MASSTLDENQIPVDVRVDDKMIRVTFSGGLELATPVTRFPRLRDAEPSQRTRWQLVGRGYGIHWPDVDEDISVRGLFATARQWPETAVEQIPALISDLLKTTNRLNELFDGRQFTPDGHLVGSIGEVVAEYIYDLCLEPASTPLIDAYTKDEKKLSVQVKLTGEKGRDFRIRWPVPENSVLPDVLLCMKMTVDGFIEVYNGPFPAHLLESKKPTSNGQIPISVKTLSDLNPKLLPEVRSFININRWFQATPELAAVA
jgi:hypothetical protein